MGSVEKSIEVGVPVSTAYNQWTQFESFPRFMAGVDRVEQISPTTTHWVTSVGGVRREFDAEIVEQRPDERIAYRVLKTGWYYVEAKVTAPNQAPTQYELTFSKTRPATPGY